MKLRNSLFDRLSNVLDKDSILLLKYPKWLRGLSVRRFIDFFEIKFMDTNTMVMGIEGSAGFGDSKLPDEGKLNALGDGPININLYECGRKYSSTIDISRSKMLDYIDKNANNQGLSFIPLTQCNGDGTRERSILVTSTDAGEIVLNEEITEDNVIDLYGDAISLESGAKNLAERFGPPSIEVDVDRSNTYNSRVAYINNITFKWGDSKTEYKIVFQIDVYHKCADFFIIIK